MSMSVDDLVASFNANHIGQEALELAALQVCPPPPPLLVVYPSVTKGIQAQLSQTLFHQSSPIPFNSPRLGPSNTPISRTPSHSISLDHNEAARLRNGSTASSKMRCSIDESQHEMDEMDEDERMVEDLLLASPTSPSSPSPSFSRAVPPPSGAPQASSSVYRPRKTSLSVHMIPLDHSHYDLPSPNTSHFATTDPFYLASLQGAHQHAQPTSVFAQAGRPSAHSPFIKHHMQYGSFGHAFQSVSPDVQPHHNMFAATAAAFTS
ncbi:hypothetical protein L226DRAFT_523385 [Lentinus tigrinus ALCF2SS1-7]|uniref:Uncharacterized protein n=1 Tax=Lentinus tigrinus ALCF2SS1-6 TaxID=1328759 RepID=A0A5C2SFM2_9APHY|nr:hypothetical protein L227DRAFT_652202 [Lentinus tigrinus ALCF2SS1-6]RPD74554.1 hypothetical protein L226DRAFT_523385 [Lentinus tigrinus ALCF2SS1-7]